MPQQVKQKMKRVDWSKLPCDIIETLASLLDAIEDFLAFSGVCRSWRSVYLSGKWHLGPQAPWLMLSADGLEKRSFFNLCKNMVYHLKLPEAKSRRCFGSPNGWLLTVGYDHQIHLLNAFTRTRIPLPQTLAKQTDNPWSQRTEQAEKDWSQFISKAVVMKKPCDSCESEDEFLILVIYSQRLAYYRPCNGSWIKIEDRHESYSDVAYVNNEIYAIKPYGDREVIVWNIKNPLSPRKVGYFASPSQGSIERLYLVESSGDLLMVKKLQSGENQSTCFKTYTLDVLTRKWSKLKDLGKCAAFISDTGSMLVPEADLVNCKPNAIYFSTNMENIQRHDGGNVDFALSVYDIASRTIETLYVYPKNPYYTYKPAWLIPSI